MAHFLCNTNLIEAHLLPLPLVSSHQFWTGWDWFSPVLVLSLIGENRNWSVFKMDETRTDSSVPFWFSFLQFRSFFQSLRPNFETLSASQNKVTNQLMPWSQACDFTKNRTFPGNGVANCFWWTGPIPWCFRPLIDDNQGFDWHWSILMRHSRMSHMIHSCPPFPLHPITLSMHGKLIVMTSDNPWMDTR